nr:hypothetical protein [Bradymonas sediminis]
MYAETVVQTLCKFLQSQVTQRDIPLFERRLMLLNEFARVLATKTRPWLKRTGFTFELDPALDAGRADVKALGDGRLRPFVGLPGVDNSCAKIDGVCVGQRVRFQAIGWQ